MAERKGLFGRLFGRKPKPEDENVEEAASEAPAEVTEDGAPAEEPSPEDAATDEAVTEEPATETDSAAEDNDTLAGDTEDFAPRTEDEEMADLDAASSTVEEGEEPVVMLSSGAAPFDEEEDEDFPETEETEPTEEATALAEEPEPAIEETLPAEEPAAEEDVAEEPVIETPAAEEPAPEPEPEPAPEEKPKRKGLFGRLREGLAKTSSKLTGGIGSIFTRRKIDDETLEELEDLLITADLGLPATTRIISTLSKTKYDQEITDEEVRAILAAEISATLKPLETPLEINPANSPHVILMTGVNGAGKTTTIGKLAKKFTDEGHKVLLAAGDTFRAAAIEQLTVWGERVGVPVVAKETGADAAGLAFDAIKKAQDENIDVVLIDTAGRLQNRKELMEELGKIVRVIKKLVPDAPHDTVLVLDATVGQNALSQADSFIQTAAVSGIVMTKLDGTARGGVLVALGDKFALPIHYIGVGESVEDLQVFDADEFARALTAPGE